MRDSVDSARLMLRQYGTTCSCLRDAIRPVIVVISTDLRNHGRRWRLGPVGSTQAWTSQL